MPQSSATVMTPTSNARVAVGAAAAGSAPVGDIHPSLARVHAEGAQGSDEPQLARLEDGLGAVAGAEGRDGGGGVGLDGGG